MGVCRNRRSLGRGKQHPEVRTEMIRSLIAKSEGKTLGFKELGNELGRNPIPSGFRAVFRATHDLKNAKGKGA